MTRDADRSLRLELADSFYIFVRVEKRQIERVRIFSEDCGLDAGGRPVTWLTSVRPAESVAFLAAVAEDTSAGSRAMKGALSALAQHGVPEAIPPLLRLARQAPETKVRSEALFWLAQRAGARAVAAITDAIDHDPETEVKKRAVFALSQLPKDEGVPKLIEVARTHRNPAVKKQAMFWLGQSKDPRALAFFEEVLK
jgi:HEAT repeat protein